MSNAPDQLGLELFVDARGSEAAALSPPRRRRARSAVGHCRPVTAPIFVDFDDGARSACGPALIAYLEAEGLLPRARKIGELQRVLIRRWRNEGARVPWPKV